MSVTTEPPIVKDLFYPESDGKPMADNTRQYEWIVTIKENLELIMPDAFIAADLFWYPVEGKNRVFQAPDVMVAQGRPKGHRGSYKQWEEDNIAPQIVFEILSPSNGPTEMARKLVFYDEHGVLEYYVYDPDREDLIGYIRKEDNKLHIIDEISGWISPLLKIRFEMTAEGLILYLPDGQQFSTFQQLRERINAVTQRADEESKRADEESKRADEESKRADEESKRAEQERQEKEIALQRAEQERQEKEIALQRAEQERQEKDAALERLAAFSAKLRQLGIDPDQNS